MKQKYFWSLIMGLCLMAMLGSMLSVNSRAPCLGSSAVIPEDIQDRAYSVYDNAALGNGAYHFTLQNPACKDGLVLTLAAMRPFSLWLNKECVYSYSDTDPYSRLHTIALPGNEPELDIQIDFHKNQLWPPKILLTTAERNAENIHSVLVLSCVSIGNHFAILLFCFSLYIQKRSEKYLLAQLFAAAISLVSVLFTTGISFLSIQEQSYVWFQHLADSARGPIWGTICLMLIPRQVLPLTRIRDNIVFLYSAAFVLLFITDLIPLVWLNSMIVLAFTLLGAVSLAFGCARRLPWMRMLMISYLFYWALTLYTDITNQAIVPNTSFLVYVYAPQIGNLVLLFVYTFVVNSRFALTFQRADELAVRLNEANATLDAKVAQRTRELLEQQELRRGMMVNIFHDLRSPIFSARGCADMMDPQEGENAECLSVIKEKLDFLSKLSEQLFLMAKLEDGKITFAQSEVPLRELCRQLAEGAALEGERCGIHFFFQGEEPLMIQGDAFRLKQALENLLQNAFQFTESGGTVSFSLCKEETWAVIQVRDSGKGIAPEDIPHVFERYYQGRNSDKQRSTGLGLAIARQLILAQGGDITVSSTLGKGTCFSVRIPLVENDI